MPGCTEIEVRDWVEHRRADVDLRENKAEAEADCSHS